MHSGRVNYRVKTCQDSPHFHLDEQEQSAALQAKKQLQQCSNEVDASLHQLARDKQRKSETCGWNENNINRASTANPSTRSQRREQFYNRTNRKISLKGTSQTQKSACKTLGKLNCTSDESVQQTQSNGRTHHLAQRAELQTELMRDSIMYNYKQKIYNLFHKNSIKATNPMGQTLNPNNKLTRSFSISKKKSLDLSGTSKYQNIHSIHSIHSSRKFDQKYENTTKLEKAKYYSFNDTIRKFEDHLCSQTYRNDENAQSTLDGQQIAKSSTAREHKINLRPEFMRLIQKIKQKQEQKSRKKMKMKILKSRKLYI